MALPRFVPLVSVVAKPPLLWSARDGGYAADFLPMEKILIFVEGNLHRGAPQRVVHEVILRTGQLVTPTADNSDGVVSYND